VNHSGEGMTDQLTPDETAQLEAVIAGLHTALTWLDADVRRLQRALDAGIRFETICEINRCIYRAKQA
jgi:hypothetical protein